MNGLANPKFAARFIMLQVTNYSKPQKCVVLCFVKYRLFPKLKKHKICNAQ